MKRYLAPLGAILLLAASLTAWAQSTEYRDVYTNFTKGISPRGSMRTTYCGQNAENGTIYFSPVTITSVEPVLADATCDGLDGATEATQDVLITSHRMRPIYFRCLTNGTLGAGETMAFQVRFGEADVSGLGCTMAAGETVCSVLTRGDRVVQPMPTAVRVTQVSDNADDDSKCILIWAFD